MKTIRQSLILAIATMMVSAVSFAQEQSDYEISQSFNKSYRELSKAIETAQTVQECAEISVNIDALEKEYTPYKALLDKALYPDDFQKKLDIVHGQLAYAQNKLGIIQESVTKIAALENTSARTFFTGGKVEQRKRLAPERNPGTQSVQHTRPKNNRLPQLPYGKAPFQHQ